MTGDVLDTVHRELVAQGAANARGYAREQALRELLGELVEYLDERSLQLMTFSDFDVFRAAGDPEQRARIQALIDVIGEPATHPEEETRAA